MLIFRFRFRFALLVLLFFQLSCEVQTQNRPGSGVFFERGHDLAEKINKAYPGGTHFCDISPIGIEQYFPDVALIHEYIPSNNLYLVDGESVAILKGTAGSPSIDFVQLISGDDVSGFVFSVKGATGHIRHFFGAYMKNSKGEADLYWSEKIKK